MEDEENWDEKKAKTTDIKATLQAVYGLMEDSKP